MALTLTGCPLKDDYFIEDGQGGGKGGASASGGQNAATGGDSTTIAGTTQTTGGTGSSSCDGVVCSAGRACNAGVCASGWVAMAKPPASFVARQRAAFTSFDGKLFVFGGVDASGDALNSAAIYDPVADTWQTVPADAAAPSPRELATAVWTGSHILVFGGRSSSANDYYLSAALYDPVTGRWSAAANSGVARAAGLGAMIGGSAIIWGGLTAGSAAAVGTSVYDPGVNTWHPANVLNGPPGLLGAVAAFSTESLFVYGGLENNQRRDNAYRYDVNKDAWTALPRGPKARSSIFGASDGLAFYVWAGKEGTSVLDDGAVLETTWTTMKTSGAPSARCAPPRQTGWGFALGPGDVVFLGGQNADGNFLKDGGRYAPSAGWSRVPSWPSGEDHSYGVAALVGREIVVWGGEDDNSLSSTGERWAP
jgi:N-acetylneuraminic acid mutarotase